MNTLELLNQHRSQRDFTTQPVSAETVSQLITTAQHASSSIFLQAYSFISVTDPALRQQIAAITTMPFVQQNGHLLIVIADQHRNATLARQQGLTPELLGGADRFLASVEDATLASQNLITAAESLGLGAVVLGSVLNDAAKLIELLHLPKLTMPVFGLLVGYPNGQNELKPRLPEAAVHFTNGYQEPTAYTAALADYQQTLQQYYQARSHNARQADFTQVIRGALLSKTPRRELLAVLQQQGFLNEAN
ncbi:NADPH-dependent oxidoreductase [Loigolactobacillus coryniformis subsp. coryniformis]|uniref:Nitro flavin reductase n=1 Tax=Loigolactobacillus coryniformis subsp. coryniformis KCTC 3167 = DSM 20001 TaxID=913848 RepID=A0A0R1F9V1_9LACO|nr:nitroreductase family protein [Loigolactobacillus coryniformis]ATO54189.1 NADPH-dependent oxidoreductase [Loigolactobacillus coryniformis subsp. coryniformis KCTC 3167 = DSM 20001]KRK15994.1 nitro flavin reductase [Loigolactobacillus coryniformis subsp. coryniformis KCTC 3167 = DSM 20001]OEH90931.1 NADPH-dependent oxidoreductase [Loigolactobacillus coryniformis subsp. coryniformis]